MREQGLNWDEGEDDQSKHTHTQKQTSQKERPFIDQQEDCNWGENHTDAFPFFLL